MELNPVSSWISCFNIEKVSFRIYIKKLIGGFFIDMRTALHRNTFIIDYFNSHYIMVQFPRKGGRNLILASRLKCIGIITSYFIDSVDPDVRLFKF
jgi:hypothetical protein